MAHIKAKMRDCGYAGQTVDFVYDELKGSARTAFEGHLAHCSNCGEDVAELSASSLAVREWCSEAFEPLTTPQFTLPLRSKASSGFAASILAFFRQPLYSASAATLLIALAVGVYFLSGNRSLPQAERAAVNAIASQEEPVPATAPTVGPTGSSIGSDVDQPIAANEGPRSTTRRTPSQPAKQKLSVRNVNERVRDQAVANNNASGKSVPEDLFGEVAETRDRSLRLTDLFAEDDED